MWQEMEKSISRESSHSQGDQELDEVLVEHFLHDGDHKDAKDATQGYQDDGPGSCKPCLIFICRDVQGVWKTFYSIMMILMH